jgi:hypothetical protein
MSSFQLNVDFDGQQANELILLPAFDAGAFQNYMRIEENVGFQRQFARVGSGYKSLRKDDSCAKENTYENEATPKLLKVSRLYSQGEICVNDYFDKFVADQLKAGVESGDLTDTQVAAAILQRYAEDLQTDINSLIWFADEDESDPFYSSLDGLFKQIKLGVAGGDIKRTETIGNGDLSDSDTRDILKSLQVNCDLRLKQRPMNRKIQLVSGAIWEGFLSLKENGDKNCTELGWQLEIDGTQAMSYRGVPIAPMWNWDRVVDEGVVGVYQNRYHAVYTTLDNLMLGTDRFGSLSQVEFWYERKPDQNYMRAKFPLGTTVFDEGLIAVAY